MSHIVTVRNQLRDSLVIQSACSRLNLPAPTFGTAKLFVTEKTGWIVKLTGRKYPAVCNTTNGEIDRTRTKVGGAIQKGFTSSCRPMLLRRPKSRLVKQGSLPRSNCWATEVFAFVFKSLKGHCCFWHSYFVTSMVNWLGSALISTSSPEVVGSENLSAMCGLAPDGVSWFPITPTRYFPGDIPSGGDGFSVYPTMVPSLSM